MQSTPPCPKTEMDSDTVKTTPASKDTDLPQGQFAEVRTFDLSPLDRPGEKKERPVKGFRTFPNGVPGNERQDGKERPSSSNNVPTDSSRLLEEEDAASHISDMSSASISQQRASASAKKPEVSSPQGPHPFYEPLQLLRKEGGKEANQVYLLMQQGRRALPDPSLNREPASLHTVCLPRRGQVKLTGLAYELDNPEFYDTRKENAGQMEQLRYDEQLIGPALPAPSCDPHRGWLIKDRNILKQVKYGEQLLHDEITEQENKLNDSNTLLNMLVGGLLHYEMPEVPNMNTNLKRFVGVKTGAAINNNDSNNQASRRQKSKSAHVIYSREGGNRAEIFQSPRHSERAYSQYLASPRVAFGDVSSDEKAQSADTPRTFHLQQNKKDQVDDIFTNISNEESPFSLHQVIAKAKKFHLNRTSDKSTQEKASVLPLIGHQ